MPCCQIKLSQSSVTAPLGIDKTTVPSGPPDGLQTTVKRKQVKGPEVWGWS